MKIAPNKLLYKETLKMYSGAILVSLKTNNKTLEKIYLTKYITPKNVRISKKNENLFTLIRGE